MSGYTNFDRQYRLAVGQAGGTGFEIGETSPSQPAPLHIDFSFQKTDLETQNTGNVTIWNLNDEHLSELSKKDCVLSLRAGYGKNLPLIFAGIVSHVDTEYDGADRRTEIEVVDNLVQIRDTFVSVSYSGTVSWETIILDTASQMGVAVSISYNATFNSISNGFSYVGKASKILTKACDSCKLSWSLQNGVLQIKRPGDVMSKEVYLLSENTGLIGTPKRVVITEDEAIGNNTLGWDVVYFLNGAINIDDYVRLESKMVTGYFRVYSLEMSGDNMQGDWTCKARLLEIS